MEQSLGIEKQFEEFLRKLSDPVVLVFVLAAFVVLFSNYFVILVDYLSLRFLVIWIPIVILLKLKWYFIFVPIALKLVKVIWTLPIFVLKDRRKIAIFWHVIVSFGAFLITLRITPSYLASGLFLLCSLVLGYWANVTIFETASKWTYLEESGQKSNQSGVQNHQIQKVNL
ncbi:MAG: hypothetical protein N2254_03445 [bacterium]|nr:hypothetical protein [bacterium]